MDVGVVRMRMYQWFVPMQVPVRFAASVGRAMGMLVMLIMRVQMLMIHRLVMMRVLVALREMMTGAGNVHLTFQLFWRGIDYYEPFTRRVILEVVYLFSFLGLSLASRALIAVSIFFTLASVAF